jgi:adenylosuccinate synthase
LNQARPIYEELPGWDEPLSRARSLEDLPENARRYITCLEELTATRSVMVSVGARREDTIILANAFTA